MTQKLPGLDVIVEELNRIPWYSAKNTTTKTDKLMDEHLDLMKLALESRMDLTNGSVVSSYADAQSAGSSHIKYDEYFSALFTGVKYGQVPAKMPLVLTLCSYYFWQFDSELSKNANPWRPLFELYKMGFTSTFNEDDLADKLEIVLEFVDGEQVYPLFH